jgi:hypothetical protein
MQGLEDDKIDDALCLVVSMELCRYPRKQLLQDGGIYKSQEYRGLA